MHKRDWRQLLDNRNLDLWNFVLRHYKIHLRESSEDNYITEFSEDSVTIFINEENIHPAPFTHELLHIYLKVKKVLIASDIRNNIGKYPQLYFLISNSLKNHIGNCLEHEKILPLFLERDFKREDFVSDFDNRIMEDEEMEDLKKELFKNDLYSRKAVDIYIGKFFSMKSNSNEQYDYRNYFVAFEKLEPDIYNVLEEFWLNWSNFEIGTVYGYENFLDAFLQKLDRWMQQNTVI